MKARGETLRGLIMARHPDALAAVRGALKGEVGLSAAAITLGVSRSHLRRRGVEWPELGALLRDGAMSTDKRARVAGAAYAAKCERAAKAVRRG